MDEIGQELFAGAGFTLNEHGGLRVRDVQREFDGASNCDSLSNDSILAISFVQRALQPHDFR